MTDSQNSAVTGHQVLSYQRASLIPGDSLCELTRPATDSAGQVYLPGTQFRVQASGMDSIAGTKYVTVTVLAAETGLPRGARTFFCSRARG